MRVPSEGQRAILNRLLTMPLSSSALVTDGKSAVSLFECLQCGWVEQVPRFADRPAKVIRLTPAGAAFVCGKR